MSKRKSKRSKFAKRVNSRLVNTSMDDLMLGAQIELKLEELKGSYERIRKRPLLPPPELQSAFQRFWNMRKRHVQDDFRSSRSEIDAMRELAAWTLQVNRAIRNQPPAKPIQWEDYEHQPSQDATLEKIRMVTSNPQAPEFRMDE